MTISDFIKYIEEKKKLDLTHCLLTFKNKLNSSLGGFLAIGASDNNVLLEMKLNGKSVFYVSCGSNGAIVEIDGAPVKDFVVETDAKDGWIYHKWRSGYVELYYPITKVTGVSTSYKDGLPQSREYTVYLPSFVNEIISVDEPLCISETEQTNVSLKIVDIGNSTGRKYITSRFIGVSTLENASMQYAYKVLAKWE